MTLFQIQFLNAVGDLLDLIPSVSPTKNSSLKVFNQVGVGVFWAGPVGYKGYWQAPYKGDRWPLGPFAHPGLVSPQGRRVLLMRPGLLWALFTVAEASVGCRQSLFFRRRVAESG